MAIRDIEAAEVDLKTLVVLTIHHPQKSINRDLDLASWSARRALLVL